LAILLKANKTGVSRMLLLRFEFKFYRPESFREQQKEIIRCKPANSHSVALFYEETTVLNWAFLVMAEKIAE
jgi:hypothetical protein